jgi:hypothetical protein
MNSYYSYPEIKYWDPGTWEDRKAATDPLVYFLAEKNYGLVRPETGERYPERADGVYDSKTNAVVFPEVAGYWKERGLDIHITGMGFVSWLAATPQSIIGMKSPKVLFVPTAVDFSNSHWAMNLLEYYRGYNETALRENTLILYLAQDMPHGTGIYMDIILEVAAIWHIGLENLYIDLSVLKRADALLPDIPGFDTSKFGGEGKIGDIPVLNIADRWIPKIAHQFILSEINRNTPDFDVERHIHSTLGRRMAEGMRLEYEYEHTNDPKLIAEWDQKGLKYAEHYTNGERWLTLTPKSAFDDDMKKLPLMVCMKEVRDTSPYQSLTALQFYYDFIEIAANGECIVLVFALETPDDNELLFDIINDAENLLPVDASRVYITGQSHNGCLALEFARRHPDIIAAAATLNDRHGIAAPNYSVDTVKITDEMVKSFKKWDLPLINLCGYAENVFGHVAPDSPEYENSVDAFRRRLEAFRCPPRPIEEFAGIHDSPDIAVRKNGLPGDRTRTEYRMGTEVYICELKNKDGDWHLSFVTVENLPHMISPQFAELSWSFMRRFSRDKDTGQIIELY